MSIVEVLIAHWNKVLYVQIIIIDTGDGGGGEMMMTAKWMVQLISIWSKYTQA